MNEKGFFTITAICLLLMITLSVKTVQETERNFSYEAKNFQIELELQNAADSGIYEAVEKIQNGTVKINFPTEVDMILNRKYRQKKISVIQPENISVEVYAERGKIEEYERKYSAEDDYTGGKGYKDEFLNTTHDGIILIAAASVEDKTTNTKKFRRSLAYIFHEDGLNEEEKYKKNIVHFMNKAERGGLNP